MAHNIFMVKFGQQNDPAVFGSKDGSPLELGFLAPKMA